MDYFALWQWAPEISFPLCEKAEISMGSERIRSHMKQDKILP